MNFTNASCCLTACTALLKYGWQRAFIWGQYHWLICLSNMYLPNTNQENSTCAFEPKAQYELFDSCSVYMFAEKWSTNLSLITVVWNIFDEGWVYSQIKYRKYRGYFNEIGSSRCREVYQNSMILFVSAAWCDTRVEEQPPNTPLQLLPVAIAVWVLG